VAAVPADTLRVVGLAFRTDKKTADKILKGLKLQWAIYSVAEYVREGTFLDAFGPSVEQSIEQTLLPTKATGQSSRDARSRGALVRDADAIERAFADVALRAPDQELPHSKHLFATS
jgi:hypothetical protein